MRFAEIGQSLFEVVIAIGVISLVIVSLVLMSTLTIRNSDFARNKTLATRYSEEALEWIRSQRDASFTSFATHSSTTGLAYCLQVLDATAWTNTGLCSSGETIASTLFRRDVTLTTIPVGSRSVVEAVINVSWSDQQGTHSVQSASDFSDWSSM